MAIFGSKITNSKQMPKVFYALHIRPGVAEYNKNKDKPQRLLIEQDCLINMNPSFSGKPVFVEHQEVNLGTLQIDADGYVVESFYNPFDGACWTKFLAVSDAAFKAIDKGWKVSNAYDPSRTDSKKGTWHNVDYDFKVLEATYNHLAIVEKPRYEESVILTEEEFKAYNKKKETELKQLQNSKDEEKNTMFKELKEEFQKLFGIIEKGAEEEIKNSKKNDSDEDKKKKEAEEKKNADEKEKKDKEEADKKNAKNAEDKDEDKRTIKVNGEEVKLKELVNCWMKSKKNAADEEEEKKKNAASEEEKKKKEEEAKNKKNSLDMDNFNRISNAHEVTEEKTCPDLSMDKLERGAARYGSALAKKE